jgi:DNA-binding SARP family transcriptional activator
MTITPQIPEDGDRIRPIQFITAGKQTNLPAPFIRVTACGLLTIEVVEAVINTDPPQARYVSLSADQLRGRGTAPALTLLKLLLSRPERFALRDWLVEQFCRDRELFSSVRLDNIVSQLRSLLCPPAYEESRTQIVAHARGSASSGDGYQLAAYPLIWTDLDALTWNVEQAARMERFGDDPLPYWERAYALARRGIFLPDERYSDWAAVRRGEVAGMLRQSVQALARLYLERHGKAGEEEALLLLRSYWQEHPQEEDVLRPLMELLGQRECYQEALEYYAKLETILSEEEGEPDARTQDLAKYVRTKQTRRNQGMRTALHPRGGSKNTSSIVEVDSGYIPFSQRIDFYASDNKAILDLVFEAAKQGIIETAKILGSHMPEEAFSLKQGDGMAYFDSAKRATLRQIAVLLGSMVGSHPVLNSSKWPQSQPSHDLDLELIRKHIDALSVLLTKGEAHYVLHAAQGLYRQFGQEELSREDIRLADIHLQLGFLVAAAQEYALAWYQRDNAVIQTYNHLENTLLRRFENNQHFREAYARLLAKRGRQHRVLWLFDLCEKECEDGLALTNESENYSLRTHFFCERAHIEATRGNEAAWLHKLEVARSGVLPMPLLERQKALNQIDYMQGEGYKRFAFHTQKDFSLSQREKYAQLALDHIAQWDGATIEVPGFETIVANISRAQCFILLNPEQAIRLANQQKASVEQHYPTLLAKIYRVLFLAQQRLQMNNDEFLQMFQGTSHAAYQTGYNIL